VAYASSVRFQWRGTAIAAQLEAAIEDAMEETGAEAESIAKGLARVDTGEMRDRIHADVERGPGGVTLTLAGDAPHTVFNELGTSRLPAQPMIRPAMDQAGAKLPERIRAKVGGIH
jgi:HK97 gp10 family phage protein